MHAPRALFVLACLAAAGCAALLRFEEEGETPRFLPWRIRDLRFPHEKHTDDCGTCHPGMDRRAEWPAPPERRSGLLIPAKEACFACHERGAACTVCHGATRPDRAPPSHTPGFRRRHGEAAGEPTARCDWCHGGPGRRGACQDCHSIMKPADHGGRWKNSTHGTAAFENRDRCFVCHRSDQCARCHRQPPENHTVFFRQGFHGLQARRNLRACYTCHDPATTCRTCHP